MTLEIQNLKVSYDRVLAISDVTLTVPPGKIVALVGGNGNGKSTTLRAVAGLNGADAGTITFNGEAIHTAPAHKRVPMGLSLVPEGRRLFPRLTVRRNLELGAFTAATGMRSRAVSTRCSRSSRSSRSASLSWPAP